LFIVFSKGAFAQRTGGALVIFYCVRLRVVYFILFCFLFFIVGLLRVFCNMDHCREFEFSNFHPPSLPQQERDQTAMFTEYMKRFLAMNMYCPDRAEEEE